MARYSVLILLVLCAVCSQAQYLVERNDQAESVIIEDEAKPIETMTIVRNGRTDNKQDLSTYKITERPYDKNRPTKKPGTYIQSVWDIYS